MKWSQTVACRGPSALTLARFGYANSLISLLRLCLSTVATKAILGTQCGEGTLQMKVRHLPTGAIMDLPLLCEDMDRHGNVRVYFRKRGRKKVRMHSVPGSDEFLAEYRTLREGNAPAQSQSLPGKGSLRWLIEQYLRSAEFAQLSPSTKTARRHIFEGICREKLSDEDTREIGNLPYAQLPPSSVRLLRDRKAGAPEAANIRVKRLRSLFSWAIENNLASNNPARDIKKLKGRKGGFHTWTVDEVRQYEATHKIGTTPRLALALFLYLGVRRSDVVRLGRQHRHGNTITFKPVKSLRTTGKTLTLPILPELERIIEQSECGDITFLVTSYNKPFAAAGFGNRFRQWCNEAGLRHCTAHGLRKAGATIAAENGATVHQLMSIFGWESISEAERYTKSAQQSALASRAMHLIAPKKMGD